MYLNEYTEDFQRFLTGPDAFYFPGGDQAEYAEGDAYVTRRLVIKVPLDDSGRYHSLLYRSERFAADAGDMDAAYELGRGLKVAGIVDGSKGVVYGASFEFMMDRAICASPRAKDHEEHDLGVIVKDARDDIVSLMTAEAVNGLPDSPAPVPADDGRLDDGASFSRYESRANYLLNIEGIDGDVALKRILADEIEPVIGSCVYKKLLNSPSLILRYADDTQSQTTSIAAELKESTLPDRFEAIPGLAGEIHNAISRVTHDLAPERQAANEIMRAFNSMPRSKPPKPTSRVTLALRRGDSDEVSVKVPYGQLTKLLVEGDISDIGFWITERERMEIKESFGSNSSWPEVKVGDIQSVRFRGKEIFEKDDEEPTAGHGPEPGERVYGIDDVLNAAVEQAEMLSGPSVDIVRGDEGRCP